MIYTTSTHFKAQSKSSNSKGASSSIHYLPGIRKRKFFVKSFYWLPKSFYKYMRILTIIYENKTEARKVLSIRYDFKNFCKHSCNAMLPKTSSYPSKKSVLLICLLSEICPHFPVSWKAILLIFPNSSVTLTLNFVFFKICYITICYMCLLLTSLCWSQLCNF